MHTNKAEQHRVLRAREFLIIGAEKDGKINPRNVLGGSSKIAKSIATATTISEPFCVELALISSSCPRQRRKKRGKVFPRNLKARRRRLSLLFSECVWVSWCARRRFSFCFVLRDVTASYRFLLLVAFPHYVPRHRLFFPRYVLVRLFSPLIYSVAVPEKVFVRNVVAILCCACMLSRDETLIALFRGRERVQLLIS